MCAAIAHCVRCGSITILLALSLASNVSAQSIIDARRVEFTPSADHSTVDASGVALVDRYSLDVFVAGGTTPVQTADLGKPAADADGMIRVDFVALLPSPLTAGVVYEALVEAVGPGGNSGGTRTNTFSFSVPCAPSLSSSSQSFTAAAGTGSTTVSVGTTCAWTAASNASWLAITAGASGSGGGTVTFSVAANSATTSRTGTLTIAGKTFTVTQAGAACTFTVTPLSVVVGSKGLVSGTITVTSQAGCTWTSASGVSWITVTGSGSGNGSATYVVAENTGTVARVGTLTIAGKTFTVNQGVKPRSPTNPRIVK